MPSSSSGLLDYLADIPDPRIERCQAHRLIDILMIAVCGAICGADNWVAIAEFGRAKADWLKTFWPCLTAFPRMIPSVACLPVFRLGIFKTVLRLGCNR